MNEPAAEFAGYLAQLTGRQASLVDGLNAAAEDCGNPRVSAALRDMAAQIEQGRPLDDVLSAENRLLPAPLRGLFLAAARTGRMGPVLTELVEQERSAADLRRSIAGALAYPLVVVCLAFVVLSSVVLLIIGPFETIFSEFSLALPAVTLVVFWLGHHGLLLLSVLLLLVLLMFAVIWLWGGGMAVRRLLANLPLVGPLWQWNAITRWLGLMAVLIRSGVPLPEALRLSAEGLRHPLLAERVRRLAAGAEGGESLAQMFAAGEQLPASLVPLLRWGESKGSLADALSAGRETFQMRVRQRCLLLQTVLPPLLFLGVGCAVLLVVGAIFLPLISLIGSLSG